MGSVKEAAQSLAQAADLHRQTQEHPWLVLGGSIALGFVAGQLLKESSHTRGAHASTSFGQGPASSGTSLGGLSAWLGQQLGEARGFAFSAIMNYAHAMLARGLDSIQEQLAQQARAGTDRGEPRPGTTTEPLQGAPQ
jgi:hypothetical protein